jgi:hypothetical protein
MTKPVVGNVLYSPGTFLGFSLMLGIIMWSYIKHIPFLLYSNIGLLITCIILLNKHAYRKNSIRWNGGWDGLSFGIILLFFVFVSTCVTVGYLLVQKN